MPVISPEHGPNLNLELPPSWLKIVIVAVLAFVAKMLRGAYRAAQPKPVRDVNDIKALMEENVSEFKQFRHEQKEGMERQEAALGNLSATVERHYRETTARLDRHEWQLKRLQDVSPIGPPDGDD
jgi:hypothetical protein